MPPHNSLEDLVRAGFAIKGTAGRIGWLVTSVADGGAGDVYLGITADGKVAIYSDTTMTTPLATYSADE